MDERMFFAQGVLMPYPNMAVSANSLSTPVLWVSRMHAITVLNHLRTPHDERPHVQAWRGHHEALALFLSVMSRELERRDGSRAMHQPFWFDGTRNDHHEVVSLPPTTADIEMPSWVGNESVHTSHLDFAEGRIEREGLRWL